MIRPVLLLMLTSAVVTRQVYPNGRSSVSLLSELLNRNREATTEAPMAWTGHYFPTPPTKAPPAPIPVHTAVKMEPLHSDCDDGKSNLTVDWDFSPMDYTCYFPSRRIIPDLNTQPILEIESVPKLYSAAHYCMNETVLYSDPFPTFGPHRPAWPRYGEYKYVPVQRWLHNLEHGGVVMLYHPCANPLEVERLRRVVRSCLFRHVISSNQHLSLERPLALISWGKRLTMSTVNLEIVKDFIMQNALQGPERISRDGKYDLELIKEAEIVSDTEDTDLCPEGKFMSLSWFW